MRDAGNLLTRAGLNIPAVDVDEIIVRYSHPARLIAHLRVSNSTLSFSVCRQHWMRFEDCIVVYRPLCQEDLGFAEREH